MANSMLWDMAFEEHKLHSLNIRDDTWGIVILCGRADKVLENFDWEGFYQQIEHTNSCVSSSSHLPLFKALSVFEDDERRSIIKFILEHLDQIMRFCRIKKDKMRKITEPFVASWDQ